MYVSLWSFDSWSFFKSSEVSTFSLSHKINSGSRVQEVETPSISCINWAILWVLLAIFRDFRLSHNTVDRHVVCLVSQQSQLKESEFLSIDFRLIETHLNFTLLLSPKSSWPSSVSSRGDNSSRISVFWIIFIRKLEYSTIIKCESTSKHKFSASNIFLGPKEKHHKYYHDYESLDVLGFALKEPRFLLFLNFFISAFVIGIVFRQESCRWVLAV